MDELPLDCIPCDTFEEHNSYFWVKCVVDSLELIGSETDSHLESMTRQLLNYYGVGDVNAETIEHIPREIVRLRGVGFWRDDSPIGLKYRCISNLAHSRERNREDPYYWWGYALKSSFELINFTDDKEKEEALNALIRENASKYGVDLHETEGQTEQGVQNVTVLLTQAVAILNLAALLLAHAEDE